MKLIPFVLALGCAVLAVDAQRVVDPGAAGQGGGTNAGTGNNNNNGNNAQGGQAQPTQAPQGGTGTGTNNTSSLSSIPQNAAAGGITITNPVQTADASYYKIASGISVTFGWNFTSIVAGHSPSSLTIQAVNTAQKNTIPIATIAGAATQVVWSPWDYQQSAGARNLPQLAQATYRLQIFDEKGPDAATNQAGVFNANQAVQFALYIPAAYTPLSAGWTCAGCKNAGELLKSYTPLLFGSAAATAICLASGAGLLRRGGQIALE